MDNNQAFSKIAAINRGEGFTKAQEKIVASIDKIESEATGLGTAFDKPLTQAAKSFDKVDKAAADSAKSLNKSSVVSEKASKAAEQLAKSAAISGGALDKSRKHTGAATQSLINLSRVAQDAPFGFTGIANNLNPLLE